MTDEERRATAMEHIEKTMGRLDRRVCMVCETPVETYDQVGRCVYADPCGHRQYQGRAPK